VSDRDLRFELELPDLATEALVVLDFEAREAIAEPSVARVTIVTHETLDPEALLGRRAVLRVRFAEDAVRAFHGVVRSIVIETPRLDTFIVRVELEARVGLLRLGRASRLFLDKSVPDVVTEVMKGAGLAAEDLSWRTRTTYAARPQIIQREESDWCFVSRLLGEEGIAFAIEHGEEREVVAFFDDNEALRPIEGATVLMDRGGTRTDHDVVFDLEERQSACASAVMLRDYDPQRPSFDLSAAAPASDQAGRQVYDHPGCFSEVPEGRRLATRLLERLQQRQRAWHGGSDSPFLTPARLFSIEGHPRAAMNGDVVALSVVHTGTTEDEAGRASARAYTNRFEAIAKDAAVRPPMGAEIRTVPSGVELAVVTCPPGEEIHTDERGRVKVRFLWDRAGVTDDRSSFWLRVGQLPLGGSMILPRGGFEVLVDFEVGRRERPLVTAHLYNGGAPPPYELPANATRSSLQTATTAGGGGANELRFEDAAGAEEIFLNASKDLVISVENDATFAVTKNFKGETGNNRELLVGTDHTLAVTGDRQHGVGASQKVNVGGGFSEGVGGDETIAVGGLRHVKAGGDHGEICKGNLSRKVGSLQNITGLAGYGRNVVKNAKVEVGAAWLEMTGRNRASQVGGARKETVGALKLVRAKNISISCGRGLTISAAAETVSCGGNRADSAKGLLTVSSAAGLSIKAASITIEAKSRLVMIAGACTIRLSSSGQVSIKAPQVDLVGVKALTQVFHKSG
jgi:type VI secretion system secreted protein VgrG